MINTASIAPKINIQRQAVLYTRVSSKRQVEEGHGLESQATRCQEYADRKGYQVIKTFKERAVSGGTLDRPSFNALLSFIRDHGSDGMIVVIDDISRFARDNESHWALRRTLKETGGTLESPTVNFGEDPDSILIENLLASVSQHQRQKNAEQTKNRMWARTMNGYWCFHAPAGYKYETVRGHGKMLVRDEPSASIIAEALEGFASGRFDTQAEVKRFLESKPDFIKKYATRTIRYEEVRRLMDRPHYAGYIEVPEWDIPLRKAQHQVLISFETFERIQARLKEGARVPFRKDVSHDFPLRGCVVCAECNHPMTSCWSKSKTGKKHPYYMCFQKGCESYRKSIRRDVLERDFEALLGDLTPVPAVLTVARKMLTKLWNQRKTSAAMVRTELSREIKVLEKKIEDGLEKILEIESTTVLRAHEKKIDRMEREKLVLVEKLENAGRPQHSFDKTFELAAGFLSSPCKLWASGQITLQKLVLKLAFSERVAYCRKEGFRTPNYTLPFKALAGVSGKKCNMAEEVSALLYLQNVKKIQN